MIEHFTLPRLSTRQQVTDPGLPQTDLDAQLVTSPLHSRGRSPDATKSFTTWLTQRVYSPWLAAVVQSHSASAAARAAATAASSVHCFAVAMSALARTRPTLSTPWSNNHLMGHPLFGDARPLPHGRWSTSSIQREKRSPTQNSDDRLTTIEVPSGPKWTSVTRARMMEPLQHTAGARAERCGGGPACALPGQLASTCGRRPASPSPRGRASCPTAGAGRARCRLDRTTRGAASLCRRCSRSLRARRAQRRGLSHHVRDEAGARRLRRCGRCEDAVRRARLGRVAREVRRRHGAAVFSGDDRRDRARGGAAMSAPSRLH